MLTELELRAAMKDMEEAALWDIRRMVLTAVHRDQAVAVRYFEEAVSEGLRGLPRRTLEDMWDELKKHPLGKQALRTLAQVYKPARMVTFEEDDLRKASVMFWESLQREDRTVRETMSSYDFAAVCKELAAISPVLNRELLARLVYVNCPGKNVIEEIAYIVLTCSKNGLKMMAGKFYERLDKTGAISEENKEIADKVKSFTTKDELQNLVHELLKMFPRFVPPKDASTMATVTVSYQGKQRQIAALVRIERLKNVAEESVQPYAEAGGGGGSAGQAGEIVLTMGGGATASVISVSVPPSSKSGHISVKSVPAKASEPALPSEPLAADDASTAPSGPAGSGIAVAKASSVASSRSSLSATSIPVSRTSVPVSVPASALSKQSEPEDVTARSTAASVAGQSVKSGSAGSTSSDASEGVDLWRASGYGTGALAPASVAGSVPAIAASAPTSKATTPAASEVMSKTKPDSEASSRSRHGSVVASVAGSNTTSHTSSTSSATSKSPKPLSEAGSDVAPASRTSTKPSSVASSATSLRSRNTAVSLQPSKAPSQDGYLGALNAGDGDSSSHSSERVPAKPPSEARSDSTSRTSRTTPADQTPSKTESEIGVWDPVADGGSKTPSVASNAATSHNRSVSPSKRTTEAGDLWRGAPASIPRAPSIASSAATSRTSRTSQTVPPLPLITPQSRPDSEVGDGRRSGPPSLARSASSGRSGPPRSRPASEAGGTLGNQGYIIGAEDQQAARSGSLSRSSSLSRYNSLSGTSRTTPPGAQHIVASRRTSQSGSQWDGDVKAGSMHGGTGPGSVAGSVRSRTSPPVPAGTPPKASRPPSEAGRPWYDPGPIGNRTNSVTSSHTSRVTPASAKSKARTSEGSARKGQGSGSFHGSISFAPDGSAAQDKDAAPKSRTGSEVDGNEPRSAGMAHSSRAPSVTGSTASARTAPYNPFPDPPAIDDVVYPPAEQPNEPVSRGSSAHSSNSGKSSTTGSSSSSSSSSGGGGGGDGDGGSAENVDGSEKGDPSLHDVERMSAMSSRIAGRADSRASFGSRRSRSPAASDRF